MGKRVLVTGATGFIGRQALTPLLELEYEVHALSSAAKEDDDCTWHQVDLLDHDAVSHVVETVKPTHLLHFAWIALPGVYQTAPENEDWLNASVHLFEECIKHGCNRIVSAGTCFEYDWSGGYCDELETPLKPSTLYGECKVKCSEALATLDVSSAWGRIFFLYGPHEYPQRLVSSVINNVLDGEEAKCSHGRQIRDFMHVTDVAKAFVALLESGVTGPVNIASGDEVTIGDVVNVIGGLTSKPDLISLGAREAPEGEPPRITPRVARLQSEVGFTPKFSLESGLSSTIAWWKSVKS